MRCYLDSYTESEYDVDGFAQLVTEGEDGQLIVSYLRMDGLPWKIE